jgi:hypothetical protein
MVAGEPSEKPAPRAGTKQAQMIEMLRRPEGATVDQIAAATGWQHHTIRGAISGSLKKKLGLTVEATRIREVGPNKTGAPRQQHRLSDHRLTSHYPDRPSAAASRPAAIFSLPLAVTPSHPTPDEVLRAMGHRISKSSQRAAPAAAVWLLERNFVRPGNGRRALRFFQ